MKKLLILLVAVLVTASILAAYPILSTDAVAAGADDFPGKGEILDATIKISVYSQDGKYYEQGLGTLVTWKGERLVVTHNHWNFVQLSSRVEFLNTKNERLLALEHREFKSLVRYRDRGSLIFNFPAGLKGTPVVLRASQAVQAGDWVTIARQDPSDNSQVDLLKAQIQAIDAYKERPVYRFRLENERIIQGDSGGGVWFNGQLVGNLWGMYIESIPGSETQTTIAAQLPSSFLETWAAEQALTNGNVVETTPSSKYEWP